MSQLPTAYTADDEQFVQELSWKLLDECLNDEEAEQLDLLLTHSEDARATYVQVVQMHVDLLDLFGGLPDNREMLKKIMASAPPKTSAKAAPTTVDEIVKSEPTSA